MADEIFYETTTGLNLYAVARNDAGQVWNGSAFVAYTTSRDLYDIALTELSGTGFYGPEDLPTGGSWWQIYLRAGGTPDHEDDVRLATGFASTGTDLSGIEADLDALQADVDTITTIVAATNTGLAPLVPFAGTFVDTQSGTILNLPDGNSVDTIGGCTLWITYTTDLGQKVPYAILDGSTTENLLLETTVNVNPGDTYAVVSESPATIATKNTAAAIDDKLNANFETFFSANTDDKSIDDVTTPQEVALEIGEQA